MNKKILFLGKFCLDESKVNQLLKELGLLNRTEFIKDFGKIKKRFSYNDYSSRNYEMIIVGQVPHKSHGTGNGRSLISDICISESKIPVYVCHDESGRLKATKSALSKVLKIHLEKTGNYESFVGISSDAILVLAIFLFIDFFVYKLILCIQNKKIQSYEICRCRKANNA